MSSQKGNVTRSRPQKHQNTFTFKNDKFDKSVQTKVFCHDNEKNN
uniref:RIKEN cDNA 1110059E24 gene n=1 Tax=Mus musculus TaxID=10090 RepID=J3QNC2_MOUSE